MKTFFFKSKYTLLLLVFFVSFPVIASQGIAQKIAPIISFLLFEETKQDISDEILISVSEDNSINTFEGIDINQLIEITHNGEIIADQYEFQILTNIIGLTVDSNGVLHFISNAETPLGEHAVEIKVIDKSTKAERVITLTLFVMKTEVVAQGDIGPEGGIVSDEWEDVVLHVPADAVSIESTFRVLRGVSKDLIFIYTVDEPENVSKGLSIRLPAPELRTAKTNPYQTLIAPLSEIRLAQKTILAQSRSLTGGWTQWGEDWVARFVELGTTNRLRNDLDNLLEPASENYRSAPEVASAQLLSLCPESNYSLSTCSGKDPVLFIHGYQAKNNFVRAFGGFGGGEKYWGLFPEKVEEEGYAVFEFVWRTDARFVDAAADLAEAIHLINKKTGKRVHIIAHSFGGLLARTYLQSYAQTKSKDVTIKYSDREDVQSLVTVGTPHSGIFDSESEYSAEQTFPKGQDSNLFVGCKQISCNQAGESTPSAWLNLNKYGFWIDNSNFLGVNKREGEIIAKLDTNKYELPVDTLILMGLVTNTSVIHYETGDNLITYAGQRFMKEWGDSRVNLIPFSLNSSTVTEKILGMSDDLTATPLNTVPSIIRSYRPFSGYFHSDAPFVRQNGGVAQVYVEDDPYSQVPGFPLNQEHHTLEEVTKWLATNASETHIPRILTLKVTVIDADTGLPISGATVEMGVDSGTTDLNGDVNIYLPFTPNIEPTAHILAEGYHPGSYGTGYNTGDDFTDSVIEYGTIKLQNEQVVRGSVYGRVADEETGEQITGVNYTLERNSVSKIGVTDNFGNYAEENLVADTWVFTFSKVGYDTKSIHFVLNSGSSAGNIELRKSGSDTLKSLNDTGITFGGEYPLGNNPTCTGETIAQQDCSHGRDASHNNDSDGHSGFSFTKLSSSGLELDPNATQWSCVQDNVTGLIWEVKTDNGDIHDKDNTYRWGGKTVSGESNGASFDDWNVLVDGSNNENFCGYNNWRLPTNRELESIVNFNRINPAIDINYFPNTVSLKFWTSYTYAGIFPNAWIIDFDNGSSYNYPHSNFSHVRIVSYGE